MTVCLGKCVKLRMDSTQRDVWFILYQHSDWVELRLVDTNGEYVSGGHLLGIDADGTLRLFGNVAPDWGLSLTAKKGRIRQRNTI